ncbi:Asp-tRNA(Asn)/Glu-tRNA(Gln) amidotransferase subunit GatC [Desulfovibrio sp. OttesenSCG-928-G15]|nr:Asp-tRNA(Asn)/Glu-tRNA(Gln) amidotransferase subunit GatC [Desulfovibrio sp. OttesenSCG-928-G15]
MPVTPKQVLATAALSRLDISLSHEDTGAESAEDRTMRLASQLDAVVGYMDILNAVDTTNVAPLYSPLENVAPPREDVAIKRRSAEEVLANAPKRQQNFFVVPPVI